MVDPVKVANWSILEGASKRSWRPEASWQTREERCMVCLFYVPIAQVLPNLRSCLGQPKEDEQPNHGHLDKAMMHCRGPSFVEMLA